MRSADSFRDRLRTVLERFGGSMRALSLVMGRDQGYVAALLDPSRPSRARPTPADLLRASDATAIPLVELLELVWDIPPSRLASELHRLGIGSPFEAGLAELTEPERATVAELIAVLGARHRKRPTDGGPGRSR